MKDIPADTVVTELKTDNNDLSVWKIESDSDIDDAFVALGSGCSGVGTIWAVKILPDELPGIEVNSEAGNTPTIGINQKHLNISNLNYVSMGDVIASVLNCFRDKDNRIVKKSKADMKKLLACAYKQGRLITSDINPAVMKEINKEIEKQR